MVPSERVAEPHVLARHVAGDAARPCPIRIVMRVGLQGRWRRVLPVASHADPIARHRAEPFELARTIDAVRVVTGDARHPTRATAQQKVTRLARGDRATARIVATLPALPGERVTREQHLMASRADPVDLFGPRHLPSGLWPGGQKRAPRREIGKDAWIVQVLARAAVARLAPDADLDQMPRREAPAQLPNGPRQRPSPVAARVRSPPALRPRRTVPRRRPATTRLPPGCPAPARTASDGPPATIGRPPHPGTKAHRARAAHPTCCRSTAWCCGRKCRSRSRSRRPAAPAARRRAPSNP